MKAHGSVFLLMLRHTWWKTLLVLAVMAGAEAGSFLASLPADLTGMALTAALWNCRFPLAVCILAGFVLISAFLAGATDGKGSVRPADTLDRLSVSPRWVLLWQGICNCLTLLLFWCVQVLLFFLLCALFRWRGGTVGPQGLLLACLQDRLFRFFLPLAGGYRPVLLAVLVLGVGFSAATASAARRRGEKGAVFLAAVLGGCSPAFLNMARDPWRGGENFEGAVLIMLFVGIGTALSLLLALASEGENGEEAEG